MYYFCSLSSPSLPSPHPSLSSLTPSSPPSPLPPLSLSFSLPSGSKRKRPSDDEGEDEEENDKPKEELWSLRDVIFLCPPLSSAPIGRVIKLDGLYAAVLFPSLKKESPGESELHIGENPQPAKEGEEEKESKDNSLLSQCRLLRRDDLVVCTCIA